MNPRELFPGIRLLKREITERFLITLRELFTHHPVYLYDEDDYLTKILIYPSYADVDSPGKQPKLLLKPGGYMFTLSEGLFFELAEELVDENGVVCGTVHKKMMNMSLTMLVHAYAEEESSDLADEVAALLVFACKDAFAQNNLLIRATQVGETDLIQTEQGIYQTVLSISLDFPWVGRIQDSGGVPADDFELPIEFPIDPSLGNGIGPYTQPGIQVFRRKLQESGIMMSNEDAP